VRSACKQGYRCDQTWDREGTCVYAIRALHCTIAYFDIPHDAKIDPKKLLLKAAALLARSAFLSFACFASAHVHMVLSAYVWFSSN
jgi:hypothetical protein